MRLGRRSQGKNDNWDIENLSDQQQPWVDALEKQLHHLWGLGRNLLLVWTPGEKSIDVLVIPITPSANRPSGLAKKPVCMATRHLD